ncbi:MAG: glycosyltransferase [Erysipelotrichaceae bacterium]|nr:glycosyltransferase [Erysipelotrichaceae bacterium]
MIDKIGSTYPFFKNIYDILSVLITIMLAYHSVYFIVGIFKTRKFKKAKVKHKYAILIAARNEEKVIGNLLDSIAKQDYPRDLLTTFVVADNCTDTTAAIARKKGAICYERFNDQDKTKGFALEFLFNNIECDYGINSFEGYFIFDADNLLNTNFVSKMNDAFDSGEKIITSYRNTKNFDENWIASTYALHWIRSSRTSHRARSYLGLATNIQGTGFLFANEIVKNGWHYTSLTEDRALTADAVSNGYMISYQDEAIFYDEQPIKLKVALRQRLRWSKGHLLAFLESGPKLFKNIFKNNKNLVKNEKDKWSKIKKSFRYRFASYDTLMQLTPFSVLNLTKFLLIAVIIYSCYTYTNGINNMSIDFGNTFLSKLNLFSFKINIEPGVKALFMGVIIAFWYHLIYLIGAYFTAMLMPIYLFIIDRKRIKKMSFSKKVLFVFTWPIFDIIGRYTTYIALFKKVTWKPIPHESQVTIDDIKENK